ncbi:hypothetical protein JTB14_006954, partial [Gonioctena quinquepunctata]
RRSKVERGGSRFCGVVKLCQTEGIHNSKHFIKVDIDYEIAFGNGELLLNNWEKSFPNIVSFLQKDGHIRDRVAKALLEKSVRDNCNENGKNASVLWAIHGYLVPSTEFCSKNMTGKTTHTKYTFKDSQESFLFCA